MINTDFPQNVSFFAEYLKENWRKQDADNQRLSNSKATERAQEQQGGCVYVEDGKEGGLSDKG